MKLRPEPLAENSTLNCDPRRDDRHATRRGAAPPKRLLKPAAGRVVKRHLELTPYRTESGEAGVAVPAGKAACVGVIVTAAPSINSHALFARQAFTTRCTVRSCLGILSVPTPFDFTGKETRIGWTAGAGIEWAFWDNWSAKIEYDFYDFGEHRVTLVDSLGNFDPAPADINQQIHTVKFGINYRFNFGKAPPPIVAKY